ncbi:MAG: 3-oxoacyl-ACP synthase [Bacteroidetes bacterium]|nr:3-oxoacyl-ACP synthase [Bacteroidota bacterium]
MSSIKEELYNYCLHHIEEQTAAIQEKINDARDAASEDTKSSAGDKYETGREMMQQEVELNMTRLNEVKKMGELLSHIDPLLNNDIVVPGSIVKTNHGNYYIAISIGKTMLDGKVYYIISAASPIGALLKGRKKGDSFSFNAKEYVIKAVE